MSDRVSLLANMPVFGGLTPETLQLITRRANVAQAGAGEAFFRQGDKSQAMYVLESGRVGIYRTWQASQVLLQYLSAGDCFGEMALIDLFPRSASALAVEPCTALEISAAMLHELYERDLEQFTILQMNMSREISRRLRVSLDLLFRLQMREPAHDSPLWQTSL